MTKLRLLVAVVVAGVLAASVAQPEAASAWPWPQHEPTECTRIDPEAVMVQYFGTHHDYIADPESYTKVLDSVATQRQGEQAVAKIILRTIGCTPKDHDFRDAQGRLADTLHELIGRGEFDTEFWSAMERHCRVSDATEAHYFTRTLEAWFTDTYGYETRLTYDQWIAMQTPAAEVAEKAYQVLKRTGLCHSLNHAGLTYIVDTFIDLLPHDPPPPAYRPAS